VAANERVAVPLSRLRWGLLGVVLLLAIAAGILYRTLGQSAPVPAAVPLTDGPAATWAAGAHRAPEFRLTDQNGASVSLAALRGRPVLVTFIDPLCRDYCPIEAQHLNDVVRAFPQGSKPVIVALSRVWHAYHVEVLTQTKTLAGVTVHTIAHTEGAYLIDAKGFQRALFLWPYGAAGVIQSLRNLSS
jgi:cytochrome oxidase Cu insertion factor (SCO1/SenC/PrrC family)